METIRFRCDSCRQALRIGAGKSGQQVSCIRCGKLLTVPGQPAPESIEEDRPAPVLPVQPEHTGDDGVETKQAKPKRRPRRKPRPTQRNWRRVRFGLYLLLAHLGLGVVSAFLEFVVLRAVLSGGFGFLYVTFFVGACSLLLEIGGYVLCLYVPDEEGARKLALANLAAASVSAFVAFLLVLAAVGVSMALAQGAQGDLTGMTRGLARLGAWFQGMLIVVFLLQLVAYVRLIIVPVFLRTVVKTLKADGLDESCVNLLKINAVVLLLGLATSMLLRAKPGTAGLLLLLVGCFSPLLHLAQTVWYVLVLVRLSEAITDKLRGR
jgi:hypothetical protein